MAYKTISVIVTDKTADEPALRAAFDLSQRYDGHLNIYCVGVDPTRYEALPAGSAAIVLESGGAEARARADDLVTWVNETLPTDAGRISAESVVVPHLGLDAGIARHARYSDLVVCTKPYGRPAGPLQVTVLEAALFGSAAPVLVVGREMENAGKVPSRILLAWDESSESLVAVRHALPFLMAAERVDVVMVDPPGHSSERSDPGGRISLMLARHGVHAEVSILSRTLPRVADCLSRFVREHAIDMVVMGGYGHSRFREAVLGGATRDMLQEASVPLLMAH